jgi:NAD(P)-dependent dehydrogenase (short-subunit alcohol dehydrogenase family)
MLRLFRGHPPVGDHRGNGAGGSLPVDRQRDRNPVCGGSPVCCTLPSQRNGRSRPTARLDKTAAIVTGAAQGIGATYAKALASEGARVSICDLDLPDAVVEAIQATGGVAIGQVCDVSGPRAVAALVQATEQAFGGVQVLIRHDDAKPPVRVAIDGPDALDLEIRITLSDPPVELRSRSRRAVAGHSPWVSSADVMRMWPARALKTIAATGAILRHLRTISTPEQPLTRDEALDRCLADVPNAYPGAFKRAWRDLERNRKRRRGQHGPRSR